ncbi:peptide-methionine (S)-S-oxide reductase [Trichlorobacter thiogenes]|uniref:Peptide methionine sulfoxide reductase MsrA n=1 Tax=Trichlorobacter thiogenes TaxID=115783 RepID=A0A1T4RBS2_9BACT|nr:peptide-methionine (S)-S-oxide reductase [Trichlorobacter thiogenes]
MEKATFAAGCFWGVEEAFYDEPGVIATRVGYTGGTLENPTYQQVCSGTTGHAEAVEVTFEPARISYEQLLKIFWQSHDPTQLDRQGPDVGSQYRSAIFYHTDEQRVLAEASREALDLSGRYQRSVVTEVAPAATFWQAEEYHQKYHKKNGGGCGF